MKSILVHEVKDPGMDFDTLEPGSTFTLDHDQKKIYLKAAFPQLPEQPAIAVELDTGKAFYMSPQEEVFLVYQEGDIKFRL